VRLELHFDILFRWLPERTAVPWVRRLVISLSPRGPRFFPGQCMWHLWWTERQWDKLFPEYLGFALKYYFTNGPYSSSFTFCCFQKDERAKPGKYSSRPPPPLPPKKRAVLLLIEEHWLENCIHFFNSGQTRLLVTRCSSTIKTVPALRHKKSGLEPQRGSTPRQTYWLPVIN